jgi:hypothetical protein
MGFTPASQPPAAGFNATAWFAAWSDHGGIAILADDRLYLRRSPFLDRATTAELDRLRTVMLRSDGGPAIAEMLARRREGDVP